VDLRPEKELGKTWSGAKRRDKNKMTGDVSLPMIGGKGPSVMTQEKKKKKRNQWAWEKNRVFLRGATKDVPNDSIGRSQERGFSLGAGGGGKSL